MKRIGLPGVLVFVTVWVSSALGQGAKIADELPPLPAGKSLKLVWHDEFDGKKLDASKWDVPPDGKRRDAWWMGKAVTLDGKGHLVIRTFKDGDRYVDGCVRTQGKFEHAFGYYVARIKLQNQPGHWSAFWMMGRGVGKIGDEGRDGTEIDIMEKPWLDDRVQHALHWDGYGDAHKSKGKVSKVPGVMEGYHTFGLLWTPEEYVFCVDGKETWRTKAGGVCQVPLYLKLSDEVGKWGGDIRQAKLPDQFVVDHVRVYDVVERPKTTSKDTWPPPKTFRDLPLLYADDFDKPVPERWAPADPGAWKFTQDGSRNVYSLFKKSTYKPEVRSPQGISILKDPVVSDFVLDVWLRSTIMDYGHRDVCLCFGHQDPTHYYYVHFGLEADPHSHTVMIVNGKPRTPIVKTRTKGTPWTDGYHHVRIVRNVQTGTIEAFFDDMSKPAMTARDKTFTWGRVGLGTFDDTAHIDRIALWGRKAEKPR